MLHNLQRQFIGDVFEASTDVAAQVQATGPLTPAQRLQIYKNNTHLALTDVLMQTFPAVTKLVDEKFMRYAAQAFIAQQRPASGDMNDYGAEFPAFLSNFPALAEHIYVADVAQLEWLRHEAWLSPLSPVTEIEIDTLYLQPHVRLLHSRWPVTRLWAFALEGGEAPKVDSGESFALIHRTANQVVVRQLNQAGYELLTRFKNGCNVVTAAQESVQRHPQFNIPDFLNNCFEEDILTGVPPHAE